MIASHILESQWEFIFIDQSLSAYGYAQNFLTNAFHQGWFFTPFQEQEFFRQYEAFTYSIYLHLTNYVMK